MKLFSCDLHSYDCATGKCDSCIKEDLTCLKEVDEVTFYQWGKVSNKHPDKLSQCLSCEELVIKRNLKG